MNSRLLVLPGCLVVIFLATAATPTTPRLTPQRIAELTGSTKAPTVNGFRVEISKIGQVALPAAKPAGNLQAIREVRFPTEFEPPHAVADGGLAILPTTPTAFEAVDTGWTVRLTARAQGELVAVYGVADYVEAEFVPGGYGEVSGPIYSPKGDLLTPNKLDQPKLQTTTTRFHLFAIPGKPYEVTFYRGAKTEKHTVTVTVD